MKKVLLIGSMNIYGGVGHMIFEFCRNISLEEIRFDFLYYEDISAEEKELIKSYQGTFYKVPRYSKNPVKFYRKITEFYKEHEYDIVHIHASTAMLIVYALPVWKSKNTKIFYQSHNDCVDGFINLFFHFLFRYIVLACVDYKIAVSNVAAQFMYGKKGLKKIYILKNGIDVNKYMFNDKLRKIVRNRLGIQEEFVIGHIGRFTYQKNHQFIIKVFEKIQKTDLDTRLLLVGNGEEQQKIEQLVREKNLTDKVIFYGISKCVEEVLCAMDCFIFPSNYEGLGIVVLEAQANGLPVVASDRVPVEAKVTDRCIMLSLTQDTPQVWADTILHFKTIDSNRQLINQKLKENGYDIQEIANELKKIYLEN